MPIENIQISQEAMAEKDEGEAPVAKPRTAKKTAERSLDIDGPFRDLRHSAESHLCREQVRDPLQ